MSYTIKEITAQETWAVRHPVLRADRPIATCAMDGDLNADTVHLGLFDSNNLIGVTSFMSNQNSQFTGIQYQLRGMGILESHQKKKLGGLLIDAGEEKLKQLKVEVLWCNARIKALNFYLRKGFTISGLPFDIENVGVHYLLSKKLQ
ncbi:GNAT family N-acetyltransferase [Leeuwenhoekiella sp. LLG6367-2.1]|uniref:GNAT family N-acetyltransferase n=1 Tax=Leeuwenhoekiella sp. LLG6367-2.1 TaxID=3160833 RepID=UPI003870192E